MATSATKGSAKVTALEAMPLILGTSIWKRYDYNMPDQCISNKKDGTRCRNRRGKENRLLGQNAYLRLNTLSPAQDPSTSLNTIKAFINAACCHCHVSMAVDAATQWFTEIDPTKTTACSSSTKSHSPDRLDTTVKPNSSTKLPPKSHGTRSNPQTCAEVSKMNLFDLQDPTWSRFKHTEWDHKAMIKAIRKKLFEPLTSDTSEGVLYCYTTRCFSGFVKIGMTRREDPNVRIQEWTRQCKRIAKLEFATKPRVFAARRLEALVHAELAPFRVCERECLGCGRRHNEWFHVSPEHAKNVALKWSSFMETMPYVLEDGQWVLDPVLEEDTELVDKLCMPLAPEVATKVHADHTIHSDVAAAARERVEVEESHTKDQTALVKSNKTTKSRSPSPSSTRTADEKEDFREEPAQATPPLDPLMSAAISLVVAAAENLIRTANQTPTIRRAQIEQLHSALRAVEATA